MSPAGRSRSVANRPGFRPVADRLELSRHVEIPRTWSQTGSQLVCDVLASWIAPDRPNSNTLSSSRAGSRAGLRRASVGLK